MKTCTFFRHVVAFSRVFLSGFPLRVELHLDTSWNVAEKLCKQAVTFGLLFEDPRQTHLYQVIRGGFIALFDGDSRTRIKNVGTCHTGQQEAREIFW